MNHRLPYGTHEYLLVHKEDDASAVLDPELVQPALLAGDTNSTYLRQLAQIDRAVARDSPSSEKLPTRAMTHRAKRRVQEWNSQRQCQPREHGGHPRTGAHCPESLQERRYNDGAPYDPAENCSTPV